MENKPWESNSTTFSSQITEICHQKFKTIGKNGKPLTFQSNLEWTVLAGIVACHMKAEHGEYYLDCISLGSGLKCLPQSKLSKTGDLIHDSHAEILARRGFLKFIINEIKLLLNSESKYLSLNDTNYPPFIIRNNVTFHMYISQAPCGDASMTSIALNQSPEDAKLYINSYNNNIDSQNYDIMTRNKTSDCNIEVSKMKDGFRRGRIDYGSFGVLRTKPGRVDSEPTLSMSCSDKIAQWNVVGLQSALISELISPIYLSSITVGDMFYLEDLNRALYERIQDITNLPHGYFPHRPIIIPSLLKFERSRSYLSEGLLDKDLIPSNIATIWIKGSESAEVLVSGRKQGATKSKKTGLYLFKTRSSVAKLSLFQDLESLLVQIPKSLVPQNLTKFTNQDLRKAYTYNMLKLASKNYQTAKQALRLQKFCEWIKCPSEIYENFDLNGELIDKEYIE
ncbi:adenosine deaminase/editase [Gigaspora rosea]|uniref:Adenosine deaminase/editase n=1 Tax=Gigaspora rosea TaxID=44941 RepID=A0A397V6N4_9GLOM|nr:adenosine deaminase/editase [Gigaspora rosea]CAG8542242.1 16837_t:CDS:10 [Gigaspora rosea]